MSGEPNYWLENTKRDYWLEAYQIMAGTTMLLPTKAHLEALRDAHVRDLAALQDTLKQIQEDFHG